MTGVFLSYAHANTADAIGIEAGLEAAGYTVFRDADREHGIPSGTRWAHELFANLARSDVVVFLASPQSMASPWCHTELAVADGRGTVAVQVQVVVPGQDAVPVHPLLADRQALPPQPSVAALVEALVVDLGRAGLPASYRFSWDPDRSPYPGLERLTAEYAPVLFGRDREVAAVIERLSAPGALPVLVIGPSGSGKSSVLRAGVLPRLSRQQGLVVLPPIEPGPAPLRRFAAALQVADPSLDRQRLEAEPDGLASAVDGLTANGGRVVAFLDQCEDLLSAPRPDVEAFVTRLQQVPRERLALVAALRSASLDAWTRDRLLGPLTPADPVSVQPLQRSGLREIILGPARLAGIGFDPPELVEQILDDTGDGQALPLLAALLEELTRGHSRESPVVVTAQRYAEIGPVQRVIERRAEQATAELRATLGMSETEAVDAYLRLAEIEPDLQLVRTEVPVEDLPPRVAAAFAVFERDRLVTRDRRDSAGDGVEVVLPMHEEVFRAWPALAAAIPARRADLVLRSSLRREAQAWSSTDPPALAGRRLADAVDWLQRNGDDADDDVRAYVRAAVRLQRRRRALTVATPLLAVVALVVGSLAVVAFQQKRTADTASLRAQALRLAGDARDVAGTRPDLSLLLALEASARSDDQQAQVAPFVALTRGAGPRAYLPLPFRPSAAALDGDGGRAVLLGADHTVQWDATAGRAVAQSTRPASAIALSADGSTVATATPAATTPATTTPATTTPATTTPASTTPASTTPASTTSGGVPTARVEITSWGASGPTSSCPVTGNVERLWLTATGDAVVVVAVDRSVPGARSTIVVVSAATCASTLATTVDGLVLDAAVDQAADVLAAALEPASPTAPGVRTWQLSSGLAYPDPAGAAGRATAVALSHQGSAGRAGGASGRGGAELGALDRDGTLRVWQLSSPQDPPSTLPGLVSSGVGLAYLPPSGAGGATTAGRWLCAGSSGDLRVVGDDVTVADGPVLRSLPAVGDRAPAEPLAVSAGESATGSGTRSGTGSGIGSATTVDAAGRLIRWSLGGGTALAAPVAPPQRVDRLAAAADGTVVAAAGDGLWLLPATGPGRHVAAVTNPTAVATRGPRWAAGTASGVVWLATGADAAPRRLGALTGAVTGVAVLDDGAVAAVDAAGRLMVFPADGAVPRRLDLRERAQAMAGDGRRVFVVTFEGSLFGIDTGPADGSAPAGSALQAVRTASAHDNATAVAVSADGRRVATGGDDRRVVVWDVAGGSARAPAKVLELSSHTDKVISLAFQPDGLRLASGGEDQQVILWALTPDGDRLTGSQLGQSVSVSALPVLAFVPASGSASRPVLAVGADGVARWPMDAASWRRLAWSLLGDRRLTAAEQAQYLQGEPTVARP